MFSRVSRGLTRSFRPLLARAAYRSVQQPRFATSSTFKRTFSSAIDEEDDGYTEEYDADVYTQHKRGITINGFFGQYAHALADGCDLTEVDKQECFDSLEAWCDISQTAELKMFLSDPSLSFKKKQDYLEKEVFNTTEDGAVPYDAVAQEMVLMLLQDGQLNKLPEILIAFRQLIDDDADEVPCIITSAEELTEAQMQQVEAKCKSLLNEWETLRTEYWVDPEILGGLVVEIGSYAQDLSASSAITKAEQAMLSA